MNSLFALCILMGWVASGLASYANFHCPTRGNSTVLIDCFQDCRQQHGADTGFCGDTSVGDHICYCDGRSGRFYQRSALQCLKRNDGFRNLCTLDCVCNHGADGGHCEWDLGFCYCENWGKNPKNIGCPAKTIDEWKAIAKEYTLQ